MRTETLYDILQRCVQNERGNYQNAFKTAVLGTTVLTGYNNKTYRIDDVDFDSSPKSTFDTRDGPKNYLDYYQARYQIKIRDPNQPLLISRAKARDIRGGQSDIISLIPELSRATGMTDNMINDIQLVAAANSHYIGKLNAF